MPKFVNPRFLVVELPRRWGAEMLPCPRHPLLRHSGVESTRSRVTMPRTRLRPEARTKPRSSLASKCWRQAYPALDLFPSDLGAHRLGPARRCKAAAKAMQRPAKTCKGVAKPPRKRLRIAPKPTQSGTQRVVSRPENSISAPPHTTKPPSLAAPRPGGPASGVAGVWGADLAQPVRQAGPCRASGKAQARDPQARERAA